MSCCDFRFIDYNYPFQDNVAISATSENPNFPASNIGKEHRSKTWRSSGYFVIDSTNNKIDFKEASLGSELTATITEGSYSKDTLAAEIKSQLESVGVETYTVTISSSTGLWTISTGGAYLDLLFSTGSNVANSIRSVIGFAGSDYTGSTGYSGALVAIHTVERVIVDLKTTEEIDTFAVLFDPRLGINYSEEAVLKLKANHANEWTAPLIDITLSINNIFSVITHYFTSDQSYRFWCFEIVDPKNPNLYVDAGTIILGKSTLLERIPDSGFGYGKDDQSDIDANKYGNNYADKYPVLRTLSFNYNLLEYDQLQTMEQIFDRVGGRKPVFVALDAQSQVFSDDNFSIFGRMEKSQTFTHRVKTYFNTKMKIEESL